MDLYFSPVFSLCLFVLATLILCTHAGHAQNAEPQLRPYIVYMGQKPTEINGSPESAHLNLLQNAIGFSKEEASERLRYSYTKSFNAFAASLSDDEANTLNELDDVVSVFLSSQKRAHTTRSWEFMGFSSEVPSGPYESDVIIGVIDYGIWPESESFDDTGLGPPPTKWKGTCQSSHNFTCNNKIIGARYYHLQGDISETDSIASPRDEHGHGSHVASIAAGRAVGNTSLFGLAKGTARGGVPSARIAVYKVCWSDYCDDANLLAAFEDAIADGVDIISVSLGETDFFNYFRDSIAIGSFHAMKSNILTSSPAGNDGPFKFSVVNHAPWLLTVAAGTKDRKFVTQLKLGNGKEMQGMALNTHGADAEMFPLVDSWNSRRSNGKIVYYVTFNEDIMPLDEVAVGAIMDDDEGRRDHLREFAVPAIALPLVDTLSISFYARENRNPTSSISKSQEVFDAAAPYVAQCSSRGPNPSIENILKPDLTAPGVNILGAWSPNSSKFPGRSYNMFTGTSMACPHAAAAAAYIKSFNPTWSPAMIKSALMTTALEMSSTKNKEAEFAYGAGHINPIAALKPGLVYDAQEIDYVKLLCGVGYSTKDLRLLTGDSSSCTSTTNGALFDLNYPTFAAAVNGSEKSFSAIFRRTVTNVGRSDSIYKATVMTAPGLQINVEPKMLSFDAIFEKKSFTVKIEGDAPKVSMSAALTWSDGFHNVRSSIVVYTV